MTTLIPKNCVGNHPAVQTLYDALYNQLGPNYRVIQCLTPQADLNGSLFWIQHKFQSLFIYLNHSTKDEFTFNKASKSELKEILKNNEIFQLLKLQKKLLPKQIQTHKAQLTPFLVVFSDITKDRVSVGLKSLGLYLLGKESLHQEGLGKLIHQLLGKQYSSKVHDYLRFIFNPETLISTQKNPPISLLSNHMLDNDQEAAMKADIDLPKEKRRTSNCNLTGVNGGASSGKSTALIGRARLLQDTYPESNILILSINKASKQSIKESYEKLSSNDNKTEISCLYQWCKEKLGVQNRVVFIDDINDMIKNKVSPHLKKYSISKSVFLHELNYILGRVIFYEKDYIKAAQTAQPYHLSKDHYSQIWKAVLLLKNELKSENLILWSELPQLVWDSIQKNPFKNNYDHILIDDSHFFPPIAFELFKKVLRPNTGQLFITQDPNQSVINPCLLWKDTELDLRGHSTRLNSFYNINPYILNASNAFYLNRLPEQTDKHILQNLPILKDKPIPALLHFHTAKDEQNRLINEVKNLINIGKELRNILIITINHQATLLVAELFKQTLNVSVDILDENQFQLHQHQKGIGICNIMHTQGLHAPHAFIFGIQELFDLENSVEKNSKEYDVLWRENTQKLSNAMTCARKKLTLLITSESIPKALISPHIRVPTANSIINAEIRYLQNTG